MSLWGVSSIVVTITRIIVDQIHEIDILSTTSRWTLGNPVLIIICHVCHQTCSQDYMYTPCVQLDLYICVIMKACCKDCIQSLWICNSAMYCKQLWAHMFTHKHVRMCGYLSLKGLSSYFTFIINEYGQRDWPSPYWLIMTLMSLIVVCVQTIINRYVQNR